MAIIMTMIMTMIKKTTKVSNNSLKKVIGKSKDLLEKILKNDKNKKYTSADEILKRLNARAEDYKKTTKSTKGI